MSAEPVLERLCNLPVAFYGGTQSPFNLSQSPALLSASQLFPFNISTLGVPFKDIHARLLSL
jgi:hypothetical protein